MLVPTVSLGFKQRTRKSDRPRVKRRKRDGPMQVVKLVAAEEASLDDEDRMPRKVSTFRDADLERSVALSSEQEQIPRSDEELGVQNRRFPRQGS